MPTGPREDGDVMKAIAKELGISRERTYQLLRSGLKKIKASDNLETFKALVKEKRILLDQRNDTYPDWKLK